jgi:hypothetical protein
MIGHVWPALTDTISIIASVSIFAAALTGLFQLREARKLRLDQVRPFVVVNFSPSILIKLEISNIGPLPAKHVKVSTEPRLDGNNELFHPSLISVLNEGLPVLMPGQILKFNFDQSSNRFNSNLPKVNRYDVTVNYWDASLKREFNDSYVLDIGSFEGVSVVPEGLESVASTLDRIKTILAEQSRRIINRN